MRTLLTTLTAVLLTACGGGESDDPGNQPSGVPLGAEYVIGFGETLNVQGGLALEFTTLVGDSRCPINAVCVWEGNARILMTANYRTTGGIPATRVIELNTNATFPTRALIENLYVVELRKLEPLPFLDSQTGAPSTPASEYEATVFIDRAPTQQAIQGP